MPVSYSEWLSDARLRLANISDTARLDSQLLLAAELQQDITHLLTWPEKLIPESSLENLNTRLSRRLAGEPIAYILGECEFWGLRLKVSPAVLIPRPDTEVLVESVLQVIRDNDLHAPRIIDLGTGSGAIAIALASELPGAKVTGVDISEQALVIARENANRHNLGNLSWQQSNWFESLPNTEYDIIVSNPPYVAEGDPHLASLTYEPEIALTAKQDGFADLIWLIQNAKKHLSEGWLFLEHGFNQADAVRGYLAEEGYQAIISAKDIAGHERCTFAKMTSHG